MASQTQTKQTASPATRSTFRHAVRLRYLHMAPRKVRLVAAPLKNLSLNEAEGYLATLPNRPAEPLLKLLKSAAANLKNTGRDLNRMVIETVRVDQGPMIKRYLPRAHGRATPIQKKMSHVVLIIRETELPISPARFVIAPKVKEKKAKKEKRTAPPRQDKQAASGIEKQAKKSGFLKKMFQRKSG